MTLSSSGAGPAAAPLVGVLALQGDVREHEVMLAAVGAEPRRVRRPEDLAGLDGLVLPGGESTTMGLLLREFELLEPVRTAVRSGLPTFGSCAGMVLLADEVLSGVPDQPLIGGLDVVVRRNAFGRQVDSFEGPVTVAGVPGGPVHGVFIRAPWAERVGPGVTVLATAGGRLRDRITGAPSGGASAGGNSEEGWVRRAVAVRAGHILATAFHPELTGDARLHGLFLEIVRDGSGVSRAGEGAP